MKKKWIALLLLLSLFLTGIPAWGTDVGEEIIILYENDVHCAVEGYEKLAALKSELASAGKQVGVVSVGDYIQGSSLGAISQGAYIVNLMNLVGYDAIALGNHEFDYKLPRLLELADRMDTKPLCCNFRRVQDDQTVFTPYSLISYGTVKIAYIGVTTPSTLTSSSPAQFLDENGNYQYDFSGDSLYDVVQKAIDGAKADGADYVVALSHLGIEGVYDAWSAKSLVSNTSGLDVVLDGHSHGEMESMIVTNSVGEEVVITSTGSKFANIGKLTISSEGISTQLIPVDTVEAGNEEVASYIEQIRMEHATLGDRKIGVSGVALTTLDESGNRIIRNSETNLGDFCADAYRMVTGADIALQNGGGIRDNIPAGDVTFNSILSVFPFNNHVCVVETTGQAILDMLELGVMNYPDEDGSFQHISGMTFELDGGIPSPVVLDENKNFVRVEGERRIKNAMVWDRGNKSYQPLQPEKTYSLASHSYLLLDRGGGATMFDDAAILVNDGMLDVEVLEIYITEYLNGVIGEEYIQSQNRIRPVNREIPEEPESSETEESGNDVPPTGDDSQIFLWGMCLVVSGVGCWMLFSRKGKENG